MTKKIAALAAALVLVLISAAACTANEDQVVTQSSSADENQSVTQSSQQTNMGTGEPEVNQKQIERETQRMKEEGVVDKNGRPAPGVDLNDYPGLG